MIEWQQRSQRWSNRVVIMSDRWEREGGREDGWSSRESSGVMPNLQLHSAPLQPIRMFDE